MTARVRISDGIRRDFPVAKKRSVSKDANERITKRIVNALFTIVKCAVLGAKGQDSGRGTEGARAVLSAQCSVRSAERQCSVGSAERQCSVRGA